MAWKQIKIRILGNTTVRTGSLSRKMLFISCMFASMIFYMIPQNSSNKLQLAFAHVFRVPLSAGRQISLAATSKNENKDTVPKSKYDELENQYLNLEQTLVEQRRKFIQLQELNDYVGKNVAYILGDIIPAAANSRYSELTIQCLGTKGLEVGQYVLARNNSVLGKISYIAPEMGKAKVKLITDSDSKIAVRIDGIDQDFIMQGNGDNSATIRNIRKENTKLTGLKVYARMEPGFTDSDLIIGSISKCDTDDQNRLLWKITVKPSWDIEEIKEIAVIVHNQQQ